jgi:hypothetical protein
MADGAIAVVVSARPDDEPWACSEAEVIEEIVCTPNGRWVPTRPPISAVTGEPVVHASWCDPDLHIDGRGDRPEDEALQICRSTLRVSLESRSHMQGRDDDLVIETSFRHPQVDRDGETDLFVTADGQELNLDECRVGVTLAK